MSFDTVKANLEKEGEKLLDELRDYLSVKQDVFRSNFCDSYHEEIMKMKSEFILVGGAALHELFIYLCLNVAKRNETKDKWFLEFPSTSAFVGSVF